MTTTVVHLLRHGEVHNPNRVVYGRLPGYHLSARGAEMARLAAGWFRGRDIAALYCSPLQRTQETAAPLSESFAVPVELENRLIEPVNAFEGEAFTTSDLWSPRVWRRVYNPFRPSWGESYVSIVERMVQAVKAARRRAWGREAVCVSHQAPIWLLRRACESRPLWHRPDRRQCNLASVTTLTFEGYRLAGVSYAEPAASLYAPADVNSDS